MGEVQMRIRLGLPLLLAILIFAVVAGCGQPDDSQNFRTKRVRDGNFEISIGVPKGKIHQKAEISVRLAVKNAGRDTEILSYTTEQRFDLEVTDSTGKRIWNSSGTGSFGAIEEQVKLEPDQVDDEDIVWDQKDYQGNPVSAAEYTLEARSMADEMSKPVSTTIKILK
jgi:hypothetical protein